MNRINIITLGTKDIVKAHEFYKKLGFITSVYGDEKNPDIIFFKTEGSKIALFPIEELAKDINNIKIHPGFSGITLAFNAKSEKEVDEIINKAKQLGAIIQKKPQKTDWGGYGGYFADLDGYYWEVAYGQMWKFDDNNMLIIE